MPAYYFFWIWSSVSVGKKNIETEYSTDQKESLHLEDEDPWVAKSNIMWPMHSNETLEIKIRKTPEFKLK